MMLGQDSGLCRILGQDSWLCRMLGHDAWSGLLVVQNSGRGGQGSCIRTYRKVASVDPRAAPGSAGDGVSPRSATGSARWGVSASRHRIRRRDPGSAEPGVSRGDAPDPPGWDLSAIRPRIRESPRIRRRWSRIRRLDFAQEVPRSAGAAVAGTVGRALTPLSERVLSTVS
jgi:hypothetical protein